jgi:hypothetical protein
MKINVTQTLTDLNGEDIMTEKGDLTLRSVLVNSLMGNYKEENISGEEKLNRFILAEKIQKNDEIELKSEEISKIKKLIAKAFTTLIVGKTYKILENE